MIEVSIYEWKSIIGGRYSHNSILIIDYIVRFGIYSIDVYSYIMDICKYIYCKIMA